MVRHSINLGYNMLSKGQVDNKNLGTIVVSVVFRPVLSVARSGMKY